MLKNDIFVGIFGNYLFSFVFLWRKKTAYRTKPNEEQGKKKKKEKRGGDKTISVAK